MKKTQDRFAPRPKTAALQDKSRDLGRRMALLFPLFCLPLFCLFLITSN